MMNLLRRRRFVNLVAEKCSSGVCSLHRLDVSQHLFYPSTAEAEAEAEAAKPAPAFFELSSLPAPTYNFRPGVVGRSLIKDHVFSLACPRVSESRILWRSEKGNTFVHDVDSHTAWSMPTGLQYMGKKPVVISAPVADEAEDLFVMSSDCGYLGFQVLRFDHSEPKPLNQRSFINPRWEWEHLPPPPLSEGSNVYSHAVVDGGRIICVSAHRFGGTYLFDTVRRDWMRRAASNWQMPFFGAPQYVPDLNLWLGVSWSGDDDDDDDDDNRYHLCASSDLGAAVTAAARGRIRNRPSVTVTHHWKEGLETPVGWNTESAELVDLGDGRYCVAKIIYEMVTDDYAGCQYIGDCAALLTGVEMVRGAGDCRSSNNSSSYPSPSSSEGEGFRMVVHKSQRYIFRRDSIRWVL